MYLDSLVGIGARGRLLRDLKDGSIEGDRIVVGHRTLLFETQSLFDLLRAGLSPGGLRFSRLGELAVMLGQIAIEHPLPEYAFARR